MSLMLLSVYDCYRQLVIRRSPGRFEWPLSCVQNYLSVSAPLLHLYVYRNYSCWGQQRRHICADSNCAFQLE
jgi:hypothetical protein